MCAMTHEDTLYVELGRRVRAARQSAGFSQMDLARRLGMSRTSITNLEQGHQRVALHVFLKLAAALGADPATLLPSADHGEDETPELRGLDKGTAQWVRRVVGSEALVIKGGEHESGRNKGSRTPK